MEFEEKLREIEHQLDAIVLFEEVIRNHIQTVRSVYRNRNIEFLDTCYTDEKLRAIERRIGWVRAYAGIDVKTR